jgi:hypothetical protein
MPIRVVKGDEIVVASAADRRCPNQPLSQDLMVIRVGAPSDNKLKVGSR